MSKEIIALSLAVPAAYTAIATQSKLVKWVTPT
jgi:hypothetical protein